MRSAKGNACPVEIEPVGALADQQLSAIAIVSLRLQPWRSCSKCWGLGFGSCWPRLEMYGDDTSEIKVLASPPRSCHMALAVAGQQAPVEPGHAQGQHGGWRAGRARSGRLGLAPRRHVCRIPPSVNRHPGAELAPGSCAGGLPVQEGSLSGSALCPGVLPVWECSLSIGLPVREGSLSRRAPWRGGLILTQCIKSMGGYSGLCLLWCTACLAAS